MPTEKPRIAITLTDELFQRIEDIRFENRYASRSATVLELVLLGIEALEKKQAGAQNTPPSGEETE